MHGVYVKKSKKGIPCVWECGGGYTNTGGATIVGDYKGRPKKPLYIKSYGELACRDHALIPIRAGDIIIDLDRHHDIYDISWYQVRATAEDETAIEPMDWDYFDEGRLNMLNAAVDKSYMYHCRKAIYIKDIDSKHKFVENVCLDEDVWVEEDDCVDEDDYYVEE